jgi:hypothetical protein
MRSPRAWPRVLPGVGRAGPSPHRSCSSRALPAPGHRSFTHDVADLLERMLPLTFASDREPIQLAPRGDGRGTTRPAGHVWPAGAITRAGGCIAWEALVGLCRTQPGGNGRSMGCLFVLVAGLLPASGVVHRVGGPAGQGGCRVRRARHPVVGHDRPALRRPNLCAAVHARCRPDRVGLVLGRPGALLDGARGGHCRPAQPAALAAKADSRPSPVTMAVVFQMGGAINRVGSADTAYSERTAQWMSSFDGNWENPDDNEANIAWGTGRLQPSSQIRQGQHLHQLHRPSRRDGRRAHP